MADEIKVKVRLDVSELEKDFEDVKKKGNSTIADIEKNEVKLKLDLDTKEVENKVNNLNKSSGLLGNLGQKAKEGFSGLKDSLSGVLNPMTAVASAGVAVVGTFFKMIDVNRKFQQSLAELQSITGVATQDLKFYSDQAKEIAQDKTLSSSLTETVNAFKLVGSAKPDLLQNKEALAEVTRQAILLSKASGDTLESSVNSLTGTLNQFNFGAEEAGRVIDVLAAGSKAGAVAIPDLSAGLEKFGAVAKANNVTVEQAVALQETLGDKQIQGAEAGTQLRNIILKLANAGKGYVNGQFDINAALEQTKNEFNNIQDPVKRSQELTKLFGLESVTAGQILLDSTDKFKQYTAAVGEQGVALTQAQTNTNTFDGALTRLSNSFEVLLTGGGGLLSIFTPVVDVLSATLQGIGNFFQFAGEGLTTFFQESEYIQKVSDLFSALFNSVKEVGIAVVGVFDEIVSSFGITSNMSSGFAKAFDIAMSTARVSLEYVILAINTFKDIIVGSLDLIKLQVKTFVDFWSSIFRGDFRGAIGVVGGYITGLSTIFTNTFGKIKNNLIDFVKGILKIAEPFASMFNIDVNKLNKQLDQAKTVFAKNSKEIQKVDNKNLQTSGAAPAAVTGGSVSGEGSVNQKAIDAKKKEKEQLLAAQKKYQKDLEKFTVEQFEKESKIQQDAFDATLTKQQLEERAVKDKYFQQIEEAKQYNETYKNDLTKSQIDITALEQKKTNELTAINDKYFKERLDAENKQLEDQKKVDQISIKNFQDAEDKKVAILKEKIELQKAALNQIYDLAKNGILLQIGLNPQDVDRVKGSVEGFIKTLNDKDAKPGEAAVKGAEAAQAAYQTVSGAIFAADTQRRQEELAALQGQQEEELKLAGDNEQKKEMIRQKYTLKEKEIKRKQAEADKRKAILDATVNTAVAIVKTFATMGFLPGLVPAALMAALGAAQIAMIAAQPIPKFEKGGAIPSSDIQGMIDGRPHSAGGVLIEAEGNEFITRKSQAMKGENLGLLEAINMSDSERDAYINRHYVMPALKAKESKANESYRHSMIEAENNLIARVSSHTLRNIHGELKNNTEAVNRLAKNNYSW
jgi:TP901 family phage tail tape measure protein